MFALSADLFIFQFLNKKIFICEMDGSLCKFVINLELGITLVAECAFLSIENAD